MIGTHKQATGARHSHGGGRRAARRFAFMPRRRLMPWRGGPQPGPGGFRWFTLGLLLLAGGAGLGLAVDRPPGAERETIPLHLALPALEESGAAESPWREIEVRRGDSLARIFQRAGLNGKDAHRLVRQAKGGQRLRRLHPGQFLSFQLNANGGLLALRHTLSPTRSVLYEKRDGGYRVQTIKREPQRRTGRRSAIIHTSLYLAGQKAGMSHALIKEMAFIFGGVIDFTRDIRAGDTFHLLYEELYLDGERIGVGEILAAELVNRGKRLTAYRFANAAGSIGYYGEDGVSMHKAFLRAPLDFTRVSSNFNPRRLHPIYKTRRPHRGTDYAAPRGTEVYAAGDGRVIEAGYTKANGQYLIIKHGDTYTTKYLHLHRRLVRQGQKVTQRMVIGRVGSSGAATGPHLHYEFLINGKHENPRTVHRKLPVAKRLSAGERERLAVHIRPWQMQLASLRQLKLAAGGSAGR